MRSTGCVDPGWEHGIAQDDRKKKVKCRYCGKVVSGGIFRLKQHLARISGEVTHCEKSPEQVCLSMRQNLEGCRSSRKRRHCEYEREALTCRSNEYDDSMETPTAFKYKGKKVEGDANVIIRFSPHRSLGCVDPGWDHCVAQDEKKRKVKCNYCKKIISGGINRFKQHLAKIPGEVAFCDKAPEDVYLKIKENMKWHRRGRKHRKSDGKEISPFYRHSGDEDEEEGQDQGILPCSSGDMVGYDDNFLECHTKSTNKGKSAGSIATGPEPQVKRSRLDLVFLNSLKTHTEPYLKQSKRRTVPDKRSRKEVISAICKFFYHAGVPPHAADSPYFQRMLELVGQYGDGLKGLSSQLLHDEIESIRCNFIDLRASWTIAGCSIMADSWKDFQGRVLINLLVSCPRGVHFLSSIDATDIIDNYENLFTLLDNAVDEIGEENVVQVITKDTASFRAAGKMLEGRRKHLFWTPCAVDYIDKMLEDFLRIKWIGECFEKAKKITKFLYKTTWILNFMKKEITGGRELLMPGNTKFSTSFLTLQNLWAQRNGLKRMFQLSKWHYSKISKGEEGKEVEKLVLNLAFWKKVHHVKKLLEPIMQVLQKIEHVDSQSMSSVYNDVYRAKLIIKAMYGDDNRKCGPLLSVIDAHWSLLFHHPLHMAAYFLNPSFRYRRDFLAHPEVIRGLNECIFRMEPDETRRVAASVQIQQFVSAKADFGTDLAISTRAELDPGYKGLCIGLDTVELFPVWWQQHGISCLDLQRIAVRVLNQTCSSVGCEHTWSIYGQVHSTKHNNLSWKKWTDLSDTRNNLRLKECQVGGYTNRLVSFDSTALLDDWVMSTAQKPEPENEEIVYNDDEQFYVDDDEAYFNDNTENEQNMPAEMVESGSVTGRLEVNSVGGTITTDDDDLNLLDDDLTD